MSSVGCSDQRSPAPLPEVHLAGQGGPLVEAECHTVLQNAKSIAEDQVHFTEGETEISKSPEWLRPCGVGGWLSHAPAALGGSEPQALDPLGRAGESPGCGHAEPAVCPPLTPWAGAGESPGCGHTEPAVCPPPRSKSRLCLQEAI